VKEKEFFERKTKLFGFPKDQKIILEKIQRLEFLLCHWCSL